MRLILALILTMFLMLGTGFPNQSASAQQVVRCHSGGTGTIAECQRRDAQLQSTSNHPQTPGSSKPGRPVLPVGPARISAGFFDSSYAQSEGRQHLGVDMVASAGVGVSSPVDGRIVINNTSTADVMQAFMVIRSTEGVEHVLGHVTSSLPVGTTVRAGQKVGTVRAWPGQPGRSHVHWGVNRFGVVQAMTNNWGWGRAPLNATISDASRRGWGNP